MPLLAGIGPLGVPELLIIAFIVVLVFGVGRLPEVGGALGKGIREFRKSANDDDKPIVVASTPGMSVDVDAPASDVGAVASEVFCSQCGTKNGPAAKFCSSCGTTLNATVS